MTDSPSPADQAQRELLRLSLQGAAQSVPGQFAAALYLLYLAIDVSQTWVAVLAGLGPLIGLWRFSLTRRYRDHTGDADGAESAPAPERVARATAELELNALASGLLWSMAVIAVYPWLHGTAATLMVLIVAGSVSLAALFMSLAGRAFSLLVLPQIGALIVVSLVVEPVRSVPLALLAAIYGAALYRAARNYRDVAMRSIRHRLEVDAVNARLQRAKDAAESASRAKTEFLATMSHEIRTPMNGVLGALELLHRSSLNQRQRRLARIASSSGATLMSLLNDLLDQSKMEAGKFTLKPAPMSLHALLVSVVALFRPNAEKRGLRLELRLGDGVPDRVIADGRRLKQVLSNLIGNAIKFTEHGRIELRVTMRPRGIGFEVSDSGIGIAPDRLDRLFDPFYQVDGPRGRHGGTGLGLSISQRIVQEMGGHIRVHSTPGEGAAFRFTLALPAAPEPAGGSDAMLLMADSAHGGLDDAPSELPLQGTVLLAEDNPVNRLIAQEMLQAMGLVVVHADNGVAALELIETERIDLVLMDCQMPVLDGYDATQRIREREARLGLQRMPILALTANALAEDTQRALAVGMDGYLTKPYTHAQLRALLETWV